MNVVTQLIGFMVLAITLNQFSLPILVVMLLITLMFLIMHQNQTYFRLLKRLKWIFIVTLLVFSFNTPGEHLMGWPFNISPSYEGLSAAITQVIRLALMLAVISHLLATHTRERLIAGLYYLLQPFAYFHLDVRRFAARLWLTLHYVEVSQQQDKSDITTQKQAGFFDSFAQITQATPDAQVSDIEEIELDIPHFSWLDFITLFLMVVWLIAFWAGIHI